MGIMQTRSHVSSLGKCTPAHLWQRNFAHRPLLRLCGRSRASSENHCRALWGWPINWLATAVRIPCKG